ncbi:MAG: amylo-alpha-1,6-glucosidase [Vicinamibacterales bacterium]
MPDVVHLDEHFPIIADTDRRLIPLRVLKNGDTFAVFDPHGDILQSEAAEAGLYHAGTRYLSTFELLLGRRRPLLLSSTTSLDNAVFTADLTNPDILDGERVVVPRGELHIFRSRILSNGNCVERIRVSNFARHAVDVPIVLTFDADFVDVFEVRGTRRERRGERLPDLETRELLLRYRGLDGVERRTRVQWRQAPDHLEGRRATFRLILKPLARVDLELMVSCNTPAEGHAADTYDQTLTAIRGQLSSTATRRCSLMSSNESLNRWIGRSMADLQMMVTETPYGAYPYAGIPWFSTPFGRDGLITAMELLWIDPEIARGVLTFLAATQATDHNDAQDAQPGKILHEMRQGEMAALGEIPFAKYYGTADATPLFVMLASAYFDRSGDRALIDRIWPNIVAALDWMRTSGDPDADGFIEYSRRSHTGLVQQGWKDSYDSIFHADGSLAEPPIALCEVQGYAYAAWRGASKLAQVRGDERQAGDWLARAETLRQRFEDAFWCEDLNTYALALDGYKRPCRVRTSNAGHCLFTGIASVERAHRTCATLMDDSSFAGWGIRTVAAGEPRYNPMSYHNGSIWPHDTALVAAGLARYGCTDAATRILGAMFDLSGVVDIHRLPELICGFHRRENEHPTLYPVACAPQAWASAAVFLLLEACLGLRLDAVARRVSFTRGTLPESIDWLQLSNLSVGGARVDLRLERHPHDLGVTVLRRQGAVDIVAVK